MKLLVDMNLSPLWLNFLAGEGFEAQHWSAVGPGNASDQEIMDYARAHHFVVLRHDLDFGSILAATKGAKPSVVQIRSEPVSPVLIGDRVVLALRQMASELGEGALLSIDLKRTRMRLLPLLS